MNRKILFDDQSALEIAISVPETGKMASIAYSIPLNEMVV